MSVVIDLDSVLETLMAGSAIAAVGSDVERPVVFTPDHRPALRLACRDALRRVALQLAPYLDAVRLDGDNPELVFDSSLRLPEEVLEVFVADTVASHVLHLMLASSYPSMSAAYAVRAAESLAEIHRCILHAARPQCLKIRPHG